MREHAAYSREELGRDLSVLADITVASKSDLGAWYQRAKAVQERLSCSDPEVLGSVPEFVWHYLSDADIRFKDSEYAALQERMVKSLISYLKRGVMPSQADMAKNEQSTI